MIPFLHGRRLARLLPLLMLVTVVACDQNGSYRPGSGSGTSGVTAVVAPGTVSLAWSNPTDAGFAGVQICRSLTAFPDDPLACKPVFKGNATSYDDVEVSNGQTYLYTMWFYDTDGNYSAGTTFAPPPIPYPAPTRPARLTENRPAFAKSGGALLDPQRMFFTDAGTLLVSDGKRQEVLRVDATTLKITEALHLTDKPLGVAQIGNEIFVGKEGEGSVEIFGLKGEPKAFLATPGSIGYPSAIDVDPSRGIVAVLDGYAEEIRVYNAASRALLGTMGAGVLMNPAGLAVDPLRQEILVSNVGDAGTPAFISLYSYASGSFGSLAATLNSAACGFSCTAAAGFSRPQGVAAANGKVFLADALLSQVKVFERLTLNHLYTLGSADAGLRELRLPGDVAVNPAGDVYVISRLRTEIVTFAGGAL